LRIPISRSKNALLVLFATTLLFASYLWADDRPRVFVTDSTSWETRGSAGGSGGAWAAHSSGGARPQTAEIIKTFGERCPTVVVNNKQENADYIVVLDHEGGKSVFAHKNKVAVFDAASGDSVVSKSTLSLGGSVQEACDAIAKHWSEHGSEIRARAAQGKENSVPSAAAPAPAVASAEAHVSVTSVPDGADIEVDGSFVGNTPSTLDMTVGGHTVTVKKAGFKPWTRNVKVTGGDVRIAADLEKEN